MSRIGIVGSGIGGLTAALLLSRQGHEVTVFERGSEPGGRVAWEAEGPYRIDKGPTIVLLPDMLRGILEEGGFPAERLELLRCDPMCAVHVRGGRTLRRYDNPAAQMAEIERLYPGEGAGFLRFMSEMAPLFPLGQAAFLERSFPNRRSFFSAGNLKLMARLRAYQSLRAAVGRYFRSEELRDAFSLQSLYIGGAPFRTPGLYTMLPYAEHAFGVWMLRGGYGALPGLIASELRRRGVHFRMNAEVTELTVEDGVCTGVVAEGAVFSFDAVLFNGEFPYLRGLLPPEAVRLLPGGKRRGKAGAVRAEASAAADGPQGIHARAARIREEEGRLPQGGGSRPHGPEPDERADSRYQPSSGCLLIYLGVAKRWAETEVHQFFLPASLDASLRELFGRGVVPADPSYYVFNPVALDSAAAPEGESVLYFLVPVPSGSGTDWEEAAGPLAERVLADAETRGFPGLAAHIRWKRIRTPADAEREGLYGGGSFGIAPVLSQSGVFRPQPKPGGIAGLYAAGASVHPGGGVPIVMQGARMAAHQIAEELRANERRDYSTV
ncbi:phytoene desaturase family protein [Paenibacillus glufosinatiresistens]|uniref:phytoene desaturase family protein n=1 Tax=Paenibacillus glufosinatiresistens TaxID=3070657 RepID=UPI00286E7BD2|nr:FAD-dependent oxidoreductase [Paenibacillus sp. YX.27]